MRELTCIICPMGCSLSVEVASEEGSVPNSSPGSGLTITGNRCPRGAVYAQEEIRAPKRMVTATCRIDLPACEVADKAAGGAANEVCPSRSLTSLTAPRRLPVKTNVPCPKEKINELLEDIYRLKVNLPVKAGQKLIADWKNSGIDVVVVRSLTKAG